MNGGTPENLTVTDSTDGQNADTTYTQTPVDTGTGSYYSVAGETHVVPWRSIQPKIVIPGGAKGVVITAGKYEDEEPVDPVIALPKDDWSTERDESGICLESLSELFGQGYDYDEKYYAAIEAVTREDVIRVAKRIFSSPRLTVFVRPAPAGAPPAGS